MFNPKYTSASPLKIKNILFPSNSNKVRFSKNFPKAYKNNKSLRVWVLRIRHYLMFFVDHVTISGYLLMKNNSSRYFFCREDNNYCKKQRKNILEDSDMKVFFDMMDRYQNFFSFWYLSSQLDMLIISTE